MKDRSSKILEILTKEKKMEVCKLAEKCNVSQVTMRKDLDQMEEKGLVKRVHGFASINDTDDINGRLAYHYEEKLSIAKKASELVHDGDTIMIESGSCCALLAFVLAQTKQNLTIVTNSAYICDYIRHHNVHTILLGGIYQNDSQCLVGPMVEEAAKNFNVEYFFIGTDGYSERTGFTNKDQLRAQAVKDMARSCDKIVVLTESNKFKMAGPVPMNLKNHSIIVITDGNIEEKEKKDLQFHQIECITTGG